MDSKTSPIHCDLSGQVAVVTGGGRGIGRAIAATWAVGLDVYWTEPFPPDDPLLKLPNVIATPHVAGVTDRSYARIADAVATNIERLRRREPPVNRTG